MCPSGRGRCCYCMHMFGSSTASAGQNEIQNGLQLCGIGIGAKLLSFCSRTYRSNPPSATSSHVGPASRDLSCKIRNRHQDADCCRSGGWHCAVAWAVVLVWPIRILDSWPAWACIGRPRARWVSTDLRARLCNLHQQAHERQRRRIVVAPPQLQPQHGREAAAQGAQHVHAALALAVAPQQPARQLQAVQEQ